MARTLPVVGPGEGRDDVHPRVARVAVKGLAQQRAGAEQVLRRVVKRPFHLQPVSNQTDQTVGRSTAVHHCVSIVRRFYMGAAETWRNGGLATEFAAKLS